MATGILAFALGVLALLQCPALPSPALVACLPLCLLLAFARPRSRSVLLFAAGFLYALGHAQLSLQQQLPAALEGESLTLRGTVASLPEYLPERTRFNLLVSEWPAVARAATQTLPRTVRLSWYDSIQRPRAGEHWQLRVRLKRPHGFLNPGGFDYEAWLFAQGIRASGYVRSHTDNRRLPSAAHGIHHWRQQLRERLQAILGPSNGSALVRALAIGDRSGLTPADWDRLRATGTGHLLAISGLHIGLVAALAYLLIRPLWSLSAWLTTRVPAQRAGLLAGLIAAGGYAALSGFAIPARRAFIMLAVVVLALLVQRRWRLGDGLALALLLVLLFDPFALLAPGLWLSFSAVAVIGWGLAWRLPQSGFWWRYGRTQALIALGLAPLLLFWFQQVPLAGFAANLVAVPWVSAVVVPLVLAGLLLLGIWPAAAALLLHMAALALDWLWQGLDLLLEWLPALLIRPQPAAPLLLIGLAGAALLLLPRAVPARWLGLLWLLPLLLPAQPRPDNGAFRLAVLDVGQGLATVIETRRHVLVYDTGARFSDRFDAGSAAVIPYLHSRGHERIDRLIVSHGDNDHIGGTAALAAQLPILGSLSSVPAALPLADAEHCRAGQSWHWDGVDFTILHPRDNHAAASNDQSCVLKIDSPAGSVLLPGDIEAPSEYDLVRRVADQLPADVLLAPHHGSRTSSTAVFIRTVEPDYTVFSAGYRNRYQFPDRDIIRRYHSCCQGDTALYSTASDGALLFDLRHDGLHHRRLRIDARRFWHNRPLPVAAAGDR